MQVTTTAAVTSVRPLAAREAPAVTTTPMPMEVITTPTPTVCLLSSPRLPFDPPRPVLRHATLESLLFFLCGLKTRGIMGAMLMRYRLYLLQQWPGRIDLHFSSLQEISNLFDSKISKPTTRQGLARRDGESGLGIRGLD